MIIYNDYAKEPTQSFSKYTVEQRGQIVEDHANALLNGSPGSPQEKKAEEILKNVPGALEK